MHSFEPFYTLWQIVEKWAKELKEPEIEVLQRLKRYSAYSTDGTKPAMIFMPTECFNAKGEFNKITFFNANRLIKGTTLTKFSEEGYAEAVKLMNSAVPPELTLETKNAFNRFAISREEFEKGCENMDLPLPRFWSQSNNEPIVQTVNSLTDASKVMASQRIAERDKYVDAIMQRIREELKQAPLGHTMINHLRFIMEANIPDERSYSVKNEIAKRVKENTEFNGCYKLLSRPPRKEVVEAYFLPPNKVR